MRLLHTADTHLGFQAYNALADDGTNRREADVDAAFAQVVDHALEQEVDLFLHAGDLFDSVRPTNRAIREAIDQLLRLRDAGIPVVVVAGNHETPKMASTGHVLELLDYFDGIHPIYAGEPETVEVAGAAVHGVPHVHTQGTFDELLETVEPTGGTDVLVLHGTAPGVEGLPTGEFNDLTLRPGTFDGFDYVALGHYHVQTRVDDRAWYAGSPERLTFAEAGIDKGCLLVDPEAGDVEALAVEPRPMVEETIDCDGLGPEQIVDRVAGALDGDLEGALVKVKLARVAQDVYQAVEVEQVKALADGALHVEIAPEVVRRDGPSAEGGSAFGALADEFEAYLDEVPVEDLEKDRLAEMARDYLVEAQDAAA